DPDRLRRRHLPHLLDGMVIAGRAHLRAFHHPHIVGLALDSARQFSCNCAQKKKMRVVAD
ncbi:MAG: hypothetical protein AAF346_23490, partial [Pseudomonadota bacterium]